MSDSLMHSIWSKYTISPEPGMSTLRDTCVALLNHSLSSSDLVPALAGVAFHPWLAEPLREVIPALKHLLYAATQHREALFDHDHSDFRLATILGLRAEEVTGAWGRLKQKLASIMKYIEHICESHPRFCTLHAPSALPSFAGESHCSLYTPASRSSPTSAPRKDFHSRQIDCTVEEFLDNGTFDRAEGVKPSSPTHRRSGGLGEELAEVREDAAGEAVATASEVGVDTGHIEKGMGKTRKECMRRLTEVPLEHQKPRSRARTRALSNLSEIGGVLAASESDRGERDVDTHVDVDEPGAKPGELKGRSGTPDELSKDSQEVSLTSKKSLYSPAPSIPAPERAHDRAHIKAARVLHSKSSATDAAATVCSGKTGAAAHCDSGKEAAGLQDSELRGDLYGNLVLTANSSTSGLLTSRAPENSQQSAEHAEPLARTITPAFFSHIARVYSAHSDSASTEPGGLQESVVAGVGSNDVLAPEGPQESAEHAEPLARTVTPVLFFLAVEKESMAIASMVNKVETDVKSRHAPVNSSRSTRELAREHAEDAPPVASAAALPELDNAHFAYGSMAVEPAAAEAFVSSHSAQLDLTKDGRVGGANSNASTTDLDKKELKSAQSSSNWRREAQDDDALKTFSKNHQDRPLSVSASEGATHPAIRTEDSGAPMELRGEHDADTCADVDEPGVENGGLKESEKSAQSSTNSPSKGVCTMRTFTGIGEDSGVTNPQVTGDACTAVDLSAAVRPDRGDRNVDTSDVVDDPGVGSEGVANEAVARMESVNEKGQDLHEGYARTSEAASDSSKLSLPARILTRTYLSNVERTRVVHSKSLTTEFGELEEKSEKSAEALTSLHTKGARTFETCSSIGEGRPVPISGSEDAMHAAGTPKNHHDADTHMAIDAPTASGLERGERDVDACADVDEPGIETGGLEEQEDESWKDANRNDARTFRMMLSTGSDGQYSASKVFGLRSANDSREVDVCLAWIEDPVHARATLLCPSGQDGDVLAAHSEAKAGGLDTSHPELSASEDGGLKKSLDEFPWELRENVAPKNFRNNEEGRSIPIPAPEGAMHATGAAKEDQGADSYITVDAFAASGLEHGERGMDTDADMDEPGAETEGLEESLNEFSKDSHKNDVRTFGIQASQGTDGPRFGSSLESPLLRSVILPAALASTIFALVSAIIRTFMASYLGARSLVGDSGPYRGWEREGIGTVGWSFEPQARARENALEFC